MYRVYAHDSQRAHQPRHPPPAGAAARQRPPPHRADERAPASRCPARRSSTTATRSAWATTSTSAIATACARRCSGAPTATPASRAPTRSSCYLPIIIDPEYHYESVNVEAQQNNLHSLLLLDEAADRAAQALQGVRPGHASSSCAPSNRTVLAFLRRCGRRAPPRRGEPVALRAVRRARPARVRGSRSRSSSSVRTPFPRIGDLPYLLTLGPHAFYWFGLSPMQSAGATPALSTAQPSGVATGPDAGTPDHPVVQTTGDWRALVHGDERPALESALMTVLPRQRWFAGKGASREGRRHRGRAPDRGRPGSRSCA